MLWDIEIRCGIGVDAAKIEIFKKLVLLKMGDSKFELFFSPVELRAKVGEAMITSIDGDFLVHNDLAKRMLVIKSIKSENQMTRE